FEYGDKAVPVLVKTLDHSDPAVRILALHLLGELKSREAVIPVERKTLPDEKKEVRVAAYKVLGIIAEERSYEVLLKGLKDPLWEVRAQAAKALGFLKIPEAAIPLSETFEDPKWWVRRNAGEALVKLGYKGREGLLMVFSRTRDENVKAAAKEWLDEYEFLS
ncbi:MAG TPA: HEAT repeat domain-containing protein, partial [bacterium]|nr:HEAT repeat domain-containing protein [bacterium]